MESKKLANVEMPRILSLPIISAIPDSKDSQKLAECLLFAELCLDLTVLGEHQPICNLLKVHIFTLCLPYCSPTLTIEPLPKYDCSYFF